MKNIFKTSLLILVIFGLEGMEHEFGGQKKQKWAKNTLQLSLMKLYLISFIDQSYQSHSKICKNNTQI